MKTRVCALLVLLVSAAALAADGPGSWQAALADLEAKVASKADWDATYAAYKEARTALDEVADDAKEADKKARARLAKAPDAVRKAYRLAREAFDAVSGLTTKHALAVVAETHGREPREASASLAAKLEKEAKLLASAKEAFAAEGANAADARKAGDDALALAEAALEADVRYIRMRADVADALRRESVPGSGWLMGLFGGLLLWGGLAICIAIAIRSGASGVEDE